MGYGQENVSQKHLLKYDLSTAVIIKANQC